MQENPMVDSTLQEAGPDDTAINASESPRAEGATLDDVLGTQPDVSRQEASQSENTKGGEKQAGWIQKRIQDGVNKQMTYRRLGQIRLLPIRRNTVNPVLQRGAPE
jgi:hypothetical protein